MTEETPGAEVQEPKTATFVRAVLVMSEVPGNELQTASLLDTTGRKVLNLHPGANDVSGLSPGVHFVREEGAVSREEPAVRKVVVTR